MTRKLDYVTDVKSFFEEELRPIKRKYEADDLFFDEGNAERELWAKQTALEKKDIKNSDDTRTTESNNFVCNVSHCRKTFNDASSFENHYHSVHKTFCESCSRAYPSYRLLELHILERHDSMFKLLAEKQNMYECFVEGCQRKFKSEKTRKMHLVDFHKYPKGFKFHYYLTPKKQMVEPQVEELASNMEIVTLEAASSTMRETEPNTVSNASMATMETESQSNNGQDTTQKSSRFSYSYNKKVPTSFAFGGKTRRGWEKDPNKL